MVVIQTGLLHTERDRVAVAPGDFVAEDLEQQILMRHLLLARERQRSGSLSSMLDSFNRRRTVLRSALITSVVIATPLLPRPRRAAVCIGTLGEDSGPGNDAGRPVTGFRRRDVGASIHEAWTD
jgi:hypothetical protein